MTPNTIILISIISPVSAILTVLLIFNLSLHGKYKKYKEIYTELERGVYKLDSIELNFIYFIKYDWNIENHTFDRTNREIIFFPNGDLKLEENLYIHKSLLWMSLHSWYYWKKFQKLKNELISDYNYRETSRRMNSNHYERYMTQQNKLDFKFLSK